MAAPLLQLVSNPQSGSYDSQKVAALAAALSTKGFRVECAFSAPSTPFIPDPSAAHICVAGGDGTVRHVAATLVSLANPPRFSVYPMGTINLIAREWGAPNEPAAFAAQVVDDKMKRLLNVVSINDTHFVACASIGPDSQAVAKVSDSLKSRVGRIAYGLSLLKVLATWKEPIIRVLANGEIYTCGTLYIANGRFFAGPWMVAPKASLGDSSLQIVMLRRARRRDFLLFLIATLFGRATSLSNVEVIETQSLEIEAERPVAVQLDGDAGTSLPAMISMCPIILNG